ncbi:MAG: T9SS type A sorting domain-containing protein [Candidatus Nomurabacteria bacterium]|nr:MAG: T9SS type A sorting domain-containing protein [Candidatus Nomurabacteria bacterium]
MVITSTMSAFGQTLVWELPDPASRYWSIAYVDLEFGPEFILARDILQVYKPGNSTPIFSYDSSSGEIFVCYGISNFDTDQEVEFLVGVIATDAGGGYTGVEVVEFPSGILEASFYPSDSDFSYGSRADLIADVNMDGVLDIPVISTTSTANPVGVYYYSLGVISGVQELPDFSSIGSELQVKENPIDRVIAIEYSLSESQEVELSLVTVLGRVVEQRRLGPQGVGGHQYSFYTSNLPSGIYFVSLRAGDATRKQKITIVR